MTVCILFLLLSSTPFGSYPPTPFPTLSSHLAGAQYSRHAVAVSQGELDLDVDPPGSVPGDPARHQPVVLARAHHVTDLIQRKIYNH